MCSAEVQNGCAPRMLAPIIWLGACLQSLLGFGVYSLGRMLTRIPCQFVVPRGSGLSSWDLIAQLLKPSVIGRDDNCPMPIAEGFFVPPEPPQRVDQNGRDEANALGVLECLVQRECFRQFADSTRGVAV